jgi:hypothetical protein
MTGPGTVNHGPFGQKKISNDPERPGAGGLSHGNPHAYPANSGISTQTEMSAFWPSGLLAHLHYVADR